MASSSNSAPRSRRLQRWIAFFFAIDAGAPVADEPVVDLARRDRGDPNGHLSARSTGYSRAYLLPCAVPNSHDR